MRTGLFLLSFLVALSIAVFLFPNGTVAILFCVLVSILTIKIINKNDVDADFNVNLFLAALLLRVVAAAVIYTMSLEKFFGPDAIAYDQLGNDIMRYFSGEVRVNIYLLEWAAINQMFYLVAGIYWLVGRNPFFIQLLNALLGAATAYIVYLCAHTLFKNKRTARVAAILTAFYPTLIVLSAQLLKDPIILFFLPLAVLGALKLQEEFSVRYLIILVAGLIGTLFIRQYIFIMLAAAILCGFFLGPNITVKQLSQRILAIALVGLILTYLGYSAKILNQIQSYQSLEQVQKTRENFGNFAASNYAQGTDVSTVGGLTESLPVNFSYMMFAPFPWEVVNFRQSLVLPEIIIWWLSFALAMVGLWFTLRTHLRKSIVILVFTLILTFAYSIIQANVGQAHRQRTQIQIFIFIFTGVGFTVLNELRENSDVRRRKKK